MAAEDEKLRRHNQLAQPPLRWTALFTIGAATPLGLKSVNVINANGPSNAVTFQVIVAGITLTSISPPNGAPGASVAVTIFGNNLTGATINAIDGVIITGQVVSATQITCSFQYLTRGG